jgi:hypothetical protein
VRELAALGAHFDTRPDGQLDLTREGGHSARASSTRDITGRRWSSTSPPPTIDPTSSRRRRCGHRPHPERKSPHGQRAARAPTWLAAGRSRRSWER